MQLLTVNEIATLLKVPTGTIYFWVSSKQIPYIKFGKHLRFEYEQVIKHFKCRPIQ